jgi:hypothetical protein
MMLRYFLKHPNFALVCFRDSINPPTGRQRSMPNRRAMTNITFLKSAIAMWVIAVLAGVLSLNRYSTRAGPTIQPEPIWPVSDRLKESSGVYCLVMTVHPECPCSRASIDELEVLMTRCHGRLDSRVLFVELPGMEQDSAATDLWKSASRIKGVTCVRDPNGELAARFHAQTSGQVFVYDVRGDLRFSGGITASRAHAGDNDGVTAIESIIDGSAPMVSHTPVFGCSLR